MSFLNDFSKDFNCVLDVYNPVEVRNDIWEVEKTFSLQQEWVKWLLFLNNKEYNAYIDSQVQYIKTTHKIRIDKYIDIDEWDKIIDDKWKSYTVVYTDLVPWFNWNNDHRLILANIIR